MLMQMSRDLSLGEAAKAIGVSADTLRRWDRAGRLRTHRDDRNRRRVSQAEVRRLTSRPQRHTTGTTGSARNRFAGTIRSVEVDGVMALVEMQAGPFFDHRRDHAGFGAGVGPGRRRSGDGGGEGDLGDDRTREGES